MVRDDDGRLLLVRNRDDGLWQTVGGGMDPSEQPADAAVREAFEETGLLVEPTRVIGVYGGPEFCLTYPNGDVVSYVGIAFAARRRRRHRAPVRRRGRPARLVRPREAPWRCRWRRTPAALVEDAFADAPEAAFAAPTWRPAG